VCFKQNTAGQRFDEFMARDWGGDVGNTNPGYDRKARI